MVSKTNLRQLEWHTISSTLYFSTSFLGRLDIENRGVEDALLRAVVEENCMPHVLQLRLEAETLAGSECVVYVVDEYNRILGNVMLNSIAYIDVPECAECALLVKMLPSSKARIKKLESLRINDKDQEIFLKNHLKGDIAVVVPTYPSESNKYLCAFVHARVRAYQEAGIKCDVICSFDHYDSTCVYIFEGIEVLRTPLSNLSSILLIGKYEKILVHFFDEKFAEALEDARLSSTQLILWSHNPETRYWDWPLFASPYFAPPAEISDEQRILFLHRDEIIKRFNARDNVTWVFVSEALRTRSEELIGIRFNRAHVIPNIVDEKVFPFKKKDAALRKKVFLARKFENVSTYALDISIRCIVELSKRPCFADMDFNVYGTGAFYDELVKPVVDFPNVHLHRRFLSRDEMSAVHSNHGIALFPTRFDSQGVAMGEAAMSGLAVVSSQIDAAEYFLPNDCGLLAEVENPVAYADIIEDLYNNPDRFTECSRRCREKVYELCRREKTIDKEIALILGM